MTDIDPLITAHADAARQSRQRSHGSIRKVNLFRHAGFVTAADEHAAAGGQ